MGKTLVPSPIRVSRHLAQSEHNRELLEIILQNYKKYKDWIITIVFYYALHRVQAKMIRDFHVDPQQHWDPDDPTNSRNTLVNRYFSKNVSNLYISLYRKSQDMRYKPMVHFHFDERFVLKIVEETLKTFEKIP